MGDKNFEVQFVSGITAYNQTTGEEVFHIPGEISLSDVYVEDPVPKEVIRFEPHVEISFTGTMKWYPKGLCKSGTFKDVAIRMVQAYLQNGGSRRVAHLALYARRYHDRVKNLTRVYRYNMGEI